MYNVTSDYLSALEHHNYQVIGGYLRLKNGTQIALGDNNIIGSPSIETQIVEDSEVFNISGLYIGTLDITLKLELGELDLIDAEIEIRTQIYLDDGNLSSPVPMGVFDVVDAQNQSEYVLKITGYDHMARLNVPLPDNKYGELKLLSTIITDITENADITFAQTWREIGDLNPYVDITVFEYAETCWKQVQFIAQILGCYVVANRIGYIEFKPYNSDNTRPPVPIQTISADERHSAGISRYSYGVKCFAYTDKFGHTQLSRIRDHDTSSIIYVPQENNIIKDRNDDNWQLDYARFLNWLDMEFALVEWYPGTVNYYGNPALDVGDMIALTGGINGERTTNFLICHNTWRFRGPQTLVSGGAPRAGNTVSSSGGGGGSSYSSIVMNLTKEIILASFTSYPGLITDTARTAARCRFSVKEETAVFLTCTMTFTGTASARILRDNIPMEIEPCAAGTLSFTLPYMAVGGVHDIRIMLSGSGELTAVQGAVWGQNITAQAITYNDWEYSIENDTVVITGYNGSDTELIIPDTLEGKQVVKIAEGAVAENSDIVSVYIPDGVEIIE